jgi:hypothetical protein
MTINPAVASVGSTVVVCDSSLTGVIPVTSSGPIVVTTGGGPVTFPFSVIPVPGMQVTQIVKT